MDKLNLKEVLRGCTPGRIQTVGFMQIIPLISEDHYDNIADPTKLEIRTTGYGSMEFSNPEDEPSIVPAHSAYLVKQAAQNHAMSHAGLIKKKGSANYSTAACVQESQTGYISRGQHELTILPFPLREAAHKNRKVSKFDKLWPAIRTMNSELGLRGAGHLEYFTDHYKKQLDQFVAEFEYVHNQVGAIVLIAGKVAGIEKAPNPEYWQSIWNPLIRTCYGTLAIMEAKKHDNKPPVPPTRVELRKSVNLASLRDNLERAEKEEYDKVSQLVNTICDEDLEYQEEESLDGFNIQSIGNDSSNKEHFFGQIVRQSHKVVYASIFATDLYRENSDWFSKPIFSM